MALPPVILVSNLQSPSQMILPPVHKLLVYSHLRMKLRLNPIGTHLIKDCDFYDKQMVNKTVGIVDPQHPKKVYKVVKALYGLHQAPRAWRALVMLEILLRRFFLKLNLSDHREYNRDVEIPDSS
uniref:Reverse transcriptase n=1 Tax=Tanacetum cinerariifolium TaxID=118510 RepID=A0A699HS01_TANCI|nr:reverse transcriptase [Tanacetum cinerariifolium]